MKKAVKAVFGAVGLEIRRKASPSIVQEKEPVKKQAPKVTVGDWNAFYSHLSGIGFNPKMILDVGAHLGGWGVRVSETFPDSRIHMIEPQIEAEETLRKLCERDSRFTFSLAGAGAQPGELLFTVWDDLQGSTFVHAPDAAKQAEGKQRVVPVITINDLLEAGTITMPDIIKVDVQGFELEVLNGSSRTFGHTELFILETSFFKFGNGKFPEFCEIVAFMAEKGYKVYDFPHFSRRPYDKALGQSDTAFAREDGFLRKYKKFS